MRNVRNIKASRVGSPTQGCLLGSLMSLARPPNWGTVPVKFYSQSQKGTVS